MFDFLVKKHLDRPWCTLHASWNKERSPYQNTFCIFALCHVPNLIIV